MSSNKTNVLNYTIYHDCVLGTGSECHDRYGCYHHPKENTLLAWVIDGATPLFTQDQHLGHLLTELNDQLLSICQEQKHEELVTILQKGLSCTKEYMINYLQKYSIPIEDSPDFWTSLGTFSITMVRHDLTTNIINECLILGDTGIEIDGVYYTDRRVHKFRHYIDIEAPTNFQRFLKQQHKETDEITPIISQFIRHEAYKTIRLKANQPNGYPIGDLSKRGISQAKLYHNLQCNQEYTLMSDGFYDIWNRYGNTVTSLKVLNYKQDNRISRDDASYIYVTNNNSNETN